MTSPTNQNLHGTLYRLLAVILMFLALAVVVVAQENERKNAMPRTGTISGRVVNENGQPIPHATIYLGAPMDPMQGRAMGTDDSGNFQVTGLDALVYTVSASAPAYFINPRDPESLPSYYRLGDSVTINLNKGGVITGTVTLSTGEPVVQASVRAIMVRDARGKLPGPGRFAIDRQTDDRGFYRIYGLPTGTYIVAAGERMRGAVKPVEGGSLPATLYFHLVPAEKESAEDVLRFFMTAVQADGSFAFNNLPPGRYWAIARQTADSEPQSDTRLRAFEEGDTRLKIRRAAEAAKSEVEFKPCQNIIDYKFPLKVSLLKN